MNIKLALGILGLSVLLAVLPTSCYAQTLEAANDGGGKIVLTARVCPKEKSLMRAHTYLKAGKTTEGCWSVLDGRVHVVWLPDSGPVKRVYEPDIFTHFPADEPADPVKKGVNL